MLYPPSFNIYSAICHSGIIVILSDHGSPFNYNAFPISNYQRHVMNALAYMPMAINNAIWLGMIEVAHRIFIYHLRQSIFFSRVGLCVNNIETY